MENRLCLNSVPTFELPEGVRIKDCIRTKGKRGSIPSRTPDIRVCSFGCPFIEVLESKEKCMEKWIYLEDKSQVEPMKEWIKSINWLEKVYGGEKPEERAGSPTMPIWRLKKIILEEFYGE